MSKELDMKIEEQKFSRHAHLAQTALIVVDTVLWRLVSGPRRVMTPESRS